MKNKIAEKEIEDETEEIDIEIEVEEEKKIDTGSLKEITPAQCFVDDMAMTTAFFSRIQDIEGKKCLTSTPYLITSTREKIKLDSNELLQRGYYSLRSPIYENRWSLQSVKEFLEGKEITQDLSAVFVAIGELFSTHIDFGSSRWIDVISCWIIGTYFHRAFAAYPYIHLNGNMSAGKSKTMLLSMLLAFNGEMSVNSTASYLTRTVNDNNSSCGIDESETLGSKEDNHVILAVFNAGYKKGTFIGKSEPSEKKGWIRKRFDAYSPKMFSGIKRLASTLASRSIPITMVRTDNKEVKNSEVNIESKIYQEIRDQLYFVMMERFKEVIDTYNALEDDDIVGREFELWRPILTIAKVIDPELYAEVRDFAIEIQEQKKEMIEEDTSALKLLESLLLLVVNAVPEHDGFYTAQEIQNFLIDSNCNPNAGSFLWMSEKVRGKWLGDELRKAGVVKGSAVQRKVNGVNSRYFHLSEEIINHTLRIYKES